MDQSAMTVHCRTCGGWLDQRGHCHNPLHHDNDATARCLALAEHSRATVRRPVPRAEIADDNPLLDGYNAIIHDDRLDAWQQNEAGAELVKRYSYGIPTAEALDTIAELGPVVEIGAGSGYWASLLHRRGVDVEAYDLDAPSRPPRPLGDATSSTYYPVKNGDTAKAAEHPGRTLLLCWPPLNSPMAAESLKNYEAAGGRRVVYVGEPPNGACADEAFFEKLGLHGGPSAWRLAETMHLPSWPMTDQRLYVFDRKN